MSITFLIVTIINIFYWMTLYSFFLGKTNSKNNQTQIKIFTKRYWITSFFIFLSNALLYIIFREWYYGFYTIIASFLLFTGNLLFYFLKQMMEQEDYKSRTKGNSKKH